MTLTTKDFIATLLLIVVGGIWYTNAYGPLQSLSSRWVLMMLLVVGILMCAQGSTETASYANPFIVLLSVLGGVSLLVVIWGLVTGAKIAVTLFAGLIALLWLLTTVRHLFKL